MADSFRRIRFFDLSCSQQQERQSTDLIFGELQVMQRADGQHKEDIMPPGYSFRCHRGIKHNQKVEVHNVSSYFFYELAFTRTNIYCLLPHSRGGKDLAFGAHSQHDHWGNNYYQICFDEKWRALSINIAEEHAEVQYTGIAEDHVLELDESKTNVSQEVGRQFTIRKSSLVCITKSIYKSIEVRGVKRILFQIIIAAYLKKTWWFQF